MPGHRGVGVTPRTVVGATRGRARYAVPTGKGRRPLRCERARRRPTCRARCGRLLARARRGGATLGGRRHARARRLARRGRPRRLGRVPAPGPPIPPSTQRASLRRRRDLLLGDGGDGLRVPGPFRETEALAAATTTRARPAVAQCLEVEAKPVEATAVRTGDLDLRRGHVFSPRPVGIMVICPDTTKGSALRHTSGRPCVTVGPNMLA